MVVLHVIHQKIDNFNQVLVSVLMDMLTLLLIMLLLHVSYAILHVLLVIVSYLLVVFLVILQTIESLFRDNVYAQMDLLKMEQSVKYL